MFHATTIVAVKRQGSLVIAGDGQVSMGNTIMKATARKVRRLHDGSVIAGFAGSTADALTLFELFEAKLREHGGNLTRAAVELTKDWRKDKILRRLEALMLVADKERILLLSGAGDVIEPDPVGGNGGDLCHAIGSGGPFALSAARALCRHTSLSAGDVAKESLRIASEICVFTNNNVVIEELA
jgi:ATP-dependent HslUV protease subunit HslV